MSRPTGSIRRRVWGGIRFEVEDDGVGFDPDVRAYGTGLQGIADRLSALSGTLDVRSEPGEGTVISGWVPAVAAAPAPEAPTAPAASDAEANGAGTLERSTT